MIEFLANFRSGGLDLRENIGAFYLEAVQRYFVSAVLRIKVDRGFKIPDAGYPSLLVKVISGLRAVIVVAAQQTKLSMDPPKSLHEGIVQS